MDNVINNVLENISTEVDNMDDFFQPDPTRKKRIPFHDKICDGNVKRSRKSKAPNANKFRLKTSATKPSSSKMSRDDRVQKKSSFDGNQGIVYNT